MAAEELVVVISAKDQASKTIRSIDKQVAALEKQKAEIEISADTDAAQKQIAAIDKALEKMAEEKAKIEVTAKVDDAIKAIDDVSKEAKKAADAAEALGAAIGPELTQGADMDRVVNDLRNMGLTFDDITANADKLGAKLREVGEQSTGGLDSALARTRGGVDELGKSASSSKSAMANMVGNAAQDVGQLGGVAGSAGVAIGQMAEYMADAAFEGEALGTVIRNFALVAGPIAAIAAVLGVVTGVMETNKERAEKAAEATKAYGQAMEESANDAVGLAAVLRDNTEEMQNFHGAATDTAGILKEVATNIPLIGGLFKEPSVDVAEVLNRIGSGYQQVGKAIGGNVKAWNDIHTAMEKFHELGLITDAQLDQTNKFLNEQRDAVKDAEQAQEFHNVQLGEANALYDELLAKKKPLSKFPEAWDDIIDAIRHGTLDSKLATDQINRLHHELGLTPSEVLQTAMEELDKRQQDAAKSAEDLKKKQEELKKTAEEVAAAVADMGDQWKVMADQVQEKAFSEALDQFDALSQLNLAQMRQDTVGAFDDVKAAIKDAAKEVKGWGKMDLTPDSFKELKGMPDAFAKVTDAVSGLRDKIQTELQSELDSGGIRAMVGKLDFFAGQVREQFTNLFRGMGLPEAQVKKQVDAILSDLSLLPAQKEILIKLTRDQEAKDALDLFMSDIEKIEEAAPTVDIRTRLQSGDVQGALDELNAIRLAEGKEPIVLKSDIDLLGAQRAAAKARQGAKEYLDQHPTNVLLGFTPDNQAAANAGIDGRNAAQKAAKDNPVVIPFVAPDNIGDYFRGIFGHHDAGGIVGRPGGIVAERGPEIINRRYLAMHPTIVPAGTRVTSRRRTARILRHGGGRGLKPYDSGGTVMGGPSVVNVNFNGVGAIGARYDLMQTVKRANLDKLRLLGTRG